MNRKMKVGWFTFTCCEDSTIIFTELLNRYHSEWLPKIEFVHARVLQSKNTLGNMDVAFVEGAITSAGQEEKLKKIRSLSKKLVAIGSCACTGTPSAQRNNFDAATKAEINGILLRFNQSETVKTVKDCVTVDAMVQGCPMVETQFVALITKHLEEFTQDQK